KKDPKGKEQLVASAEGEVLVYDASDTVEYEIPKSAAEVYKKGSWIRSSELHSAGIKGAYGGLVLSVGPAKKKEEKTKGRAKEEKYAVSICVGHFYPYLIGSVFFVEEDARVVKGEILLRERAVSGDAGKTKDIVQGLPRVEELFEARKPKESAFLSDIDGRVDFENLPAYRQISVSTEEARKEYKVPYGVRVNVFAGQTVVKGETLTEGIKSPHDILLTQGVGSAQQYLGDEVQMVYRSQGVSINSKHIEVIVRQMTRKISIVEIGESAYLPNELVDMNTLKRINKKLVEEGKEGASGVRSLLGITRASLNTESFISASSFQQTASVLTRAAVEGQVDPMYGLKENVIIGKLIPAGTGLPLYQRVGLQAMAEPIEEKTEEPAVELEAAKKL
ncbi:MAG: hypothetical protein ACI9BD_000535, partial [Candidatus Marinamargulisbacteria bacterium]